MASTRWTRQQLEARITELYLYAQAQGAVITTLGPSSQGTHHYLVHRKDNVLEVSVTPQGVLWLSTEQGMSNNGRMTPGFLAWMERGGIRYELDHPFSDEACQYLAGEDSYPVYAPSVGRQVTQELARSGGLIHHLIPCSPQWFAVYASPCDVLLPEKDMGRFEMRPIVGWALVNGEKCAVGSATSAAVPCVVALFVWDAEYESQPDAYPHVVTHDDALFLGYSYPGCPLNWNQQAASRQRALLESPEQAEGGR